MSSSVINLHLQEDSQPVGGWDALQDLGLTPKRRRTTGTLEESSPTILQDMCSAGPSARPTTPHPDTTEAGGDDRMESADFRHHGCAPRATRAQAVPEPAMRIEEAQQQAEAEQERVHNLAESTSRMLGAGSAKDPAEMLRAFYELAANCTTCAAGDSTETEDLGRLAQVWHP
jgi:hypothetical protein